MIMLRYLFVAALLGGFIGAPGGAAAAGDQVPPEEAAAAGIQDTEEDTPDAGAAPQETAPEAENAGLPPEVSQKAVALHESVAQFVRKLDRNESVHFFRIYNGYNMVGTVRTVEEDLGNAVTACGLANPDMKKKLNERFKTWQEEVDPVLEEANAGIDNMVVAQDYAEPGKIRDILKMVDALRKEKDASLGKVPVTTKEACDYMLGKMDETQNVMSRLLRSVMMSYPGELAPVDKKPAEDKQDG